MIWGLRTCGRGEQWWWMNSYCVLCWLELLLDTFWFRVRFLKRSLPVSDRIWSALPPLTPQCSWGGSTASPCGCNVALVPWREGGLGGILFTMAQNRDVCKYKCWLLRSAFLCFLLPQHFYPDALFLSSGSHKKLIFSNFGLFALIHDFTNTFIC